MLSRKPRIGVLLGDPTGIGPELVAKLVTEPEIYDKAQIVIIGDYRLFEMGQRIAGTDTAVSLAATVEEVRSLPDRPAFLDFPTLDPVCIEIGKLNPKAGKSVWDTLLYAIDLAKKEKIDGFIFAPFNKRALHMSGCPFESELDLFKAEFNRPEVRGELNVLDNIWNSRVTSHVALGQVCSLITPQSVYETIRFVDRALRDYGTKTPRLAVAALNPHGGEGCLFGTEERDAIAPAIKRARAEGVNAQGPFPSDTLFLKVRAGEYDAVVSMYHDQGQIALKLLGFDKGVTVHGGFPIPIATPAHGTAFDIAGQGKANPEGLKRAFIIASQMAANQKEANVDKS